MSFNPDAVTDVLDFWFGDGLRNDWPSTERKELWFGGGAEQDRVIRDRFSAGVDAALDGGLAHWESRLPSRLALVILLDQFTRNVYRGQARAFAGDARAQQLVLRTLEARKTSRWPALAACSSTCRSCTPKTSACRSAASNASPPCTPAARPSCATSWPAT